MKLTLLAITAALMSFGCAHTVTHFAFNPTTGQTTWDNPKDSSFDEMSIAVTTNGTKTATIKGWKSSNNPEVLKAAGDSNAQMVNAVGTQIINAIDAGAGLAQTMGTQAAASQLSQGVKAALSKSTAPTPAPAPATPATP